MGRRVSEHINKGGMRGQIEVERQRVTLLDKEMNWRKELSSSLPDKSEKI